ncbi:MAG: hypothetical protein ACI38Q_02940 [Candidatus Bruticola sp.]
MKIIRLALWCWLAAIVLFISSELYLAAKGVNLSGCALLHSRRSLVPQYLRQAWDECGWGWEVGSYPSEEDNQVVQHVGIDGLRVSRAEIDKPGSRRVALFGCSFTFGCGVADEATFPYLLNERFPDTVFDNYGVSGFGAHQSLMAMRRVLEQKKYDLAVYGMIPLHLTRNVDRRVWGILRGNGAYKLQPYVELQEGELIEHTSDSFSWFGEEQFLTINFLKRVWSAYFFNAHSDKLFQPRGLEDTGSWAFQINDYIRNNILGAEVVEIPSASYLVKVQHKLLDSMYEVCRKNNCKFSVLILDNNANLFAQGCRSMGTNYDFCLIDPPGSQQAQNRVKGNTSNHPGPVIHRAWADAFEPWLRREGFR